MGSTTTHGDSHSCDSLSIDSPGHIVFVSTLRPPSPRSQTQTSFSDGFHRGKRSPVFSTRCWNLLRNLPPSQAFLRIEIGRYQQRIWAQAESDQPGKGRVLEEERTRV